MCRTPPPAACAGAPCTLCCHPGGQPGIGPSGKVCAASLFLLNPDCKPTHARGSQPGGAPVVIKLAAVAGGLAAAGALGVAEAAAACGRGGGVGTVKPRACALPPLRRIRQLHIADAAARAAAAPAKDAAWGGGVEACAQAPAPAHIPRSPRIPRRRCRTPRRTSWPASRRRCSSRCSARSRRRRRSSRR